MTDAQLLNGSEHVLINGLHNVKSANYIIKHNENVQRMQAARAQMAKDAQRHDKLVAAKAKAAADAAKRQAALKQHQVDVLKHQQAEAKKAVDDKAHAAYQAAKVKAAADAENVNRLKRRLPPTLLSIKQY